MCYQLAVENVLVANLIGVWSESKFPEIHVWSIILHPFPYVAPPQQRQLRKQPSHHRILHILKKTGRTRDLCCCKLLFKTATHGNHSCLKTLFGLAPPKQQDSGLTQTHAPHSATSMVHTKPLQTNQKRSVQPAPWWRLAWKTDRRCLPFAVATQAPEPWAASERWVPGACYNCSPGRFQRTARALAPEGGACGQVVSGLRNNKLSENGD